MSRDPSRDENRDLLGAYALDALDADERAAVERQLTRDEAARLEADAFRETATLLAVAAAGGEQAPAGLFDRIVDAIAEPAGEAAEAGAEGEHGEVVALRPRRARWAWALAPVAAAAAVAIAVLAVRVGDLERELDEARRPAAMNDVFDRASLMEGARQIELAAADDPAARIVFMPDGTGLLRNDGLAPLPADRTYQLWALVGDAESPRAISAGVLGNDPTVVGFTVSGPVVGFAVTEEVAGGVVSSEHEPVAAVELPPS